MRIDQGRVCKTTSMYANQLVCETTDFRRYDQPTVLSVLSQKRKLLSEETCTLIFISHLSPFRAVEHYYKPVTINVNTVD